jgi:2-keto-4-pentenoate hydratase
MTNAFEALAQNLAAAWRDGTTIALPPLGHGPRTRAEAYAVQDRMAQLIGGPLAGWKVGATVPAVRVFEGHDGPLPGRIFADRCFDSPARAEARLYPGLKIECEFAFRLARDLSAGDALTRAALAEAFTFHPAIELSASRYAPGTGNRASSTFDGIADNGSGGAAVIGAAVGDWRHLDFATMAIDARIDGSPPIQAYGGAYRRDSFDIVVETLADLRARGVALARGQVILTGSSTLPTPLRKGQTLVARFADLPAINLAMV